MRTGLHMLYMITHMLCRNHCNLPATVWSLCVKLNSQEAERDTERETHTLCLCSTCVLEMHRDGKEICDSE